jgi:hypothetical protein
VANQILQSDWRPVALRLRTLLALIICLIALVVAIVVLHIFAEHSRLYQTVFVYQSAVTIFKRHLPVVAPFSIVPTAIAVGIGLWWNSLDSILRRLQPYLSQAKTSTRISHGAALSYQSSYWVWASVKAGFNRHWFLCFVTLGTCFSQICMSTAVDSLVGLANPDP